MATSPKELGITLDTSSSGEKDPDESQIPQEEHERNDDDTDLEKGHSNDDEQRAIDARLVGWDGPDDPENPRNWTFAHKWAAVGVVSSFTLMTPIASSMVAPALPDIDEDLGITSSIVSQMTLSIFILSYGQFSLPVDVYPRC